MNLALLTLRDGKNITINHRYLQELYCNQGTNGLHQGWYKDHR